MEKENQRRRRRLLPPPQCPPTFSPSSRVPGTLATALEECWWCTERCLDWGVGGGPDLIVLMAKSEDDYIETTLGALLPYGFGPANLEMDPLPAE